MKRCINSSFTDIYFHLAAEEYLLKQGMEDVFMLWQDTPSVVLGKHQRVLSEVNQDWVEQQGIPVARRFSGGGTVYHDLGNVNLTFIETTARLPDFTIYLQRTLNFLASVGLSAEGDERLGIYLNGLKISGSAQCVYKNRVLYHCTLLYDTDLDRLNKAINPVKEQERLGSREQKMVPTVYAVPSVRSEVTNVRMYLPLSIAQFKKRIFEFFSGQQTISSFDEGELKAIRQLKDEKYSQPAWIYSR